MSVEACEFVSWEGVGIAAIFVGRMKRALNRIGRHVFVYAILRGINFAARRAYLQYRPDRYADRFGEIASLQKLWEYGRRGNNRGDYARLYFLIANIEALDKAEIAGAFAELGVFKGSSAKIMHTL